MSASRPSPTPVQSWESPGLTRWIGARFVRDINIDEKKRDKTADDILAGEFLLCQGVRFHFDVRHPYRALEGAIMALRRHRDLDDARIVRARARARDILKWTPHFTDAYFHYTPSQMMLAALSLADRGLAERLLHDTFHHDAARPLPPAVEQERMAAAIARCRDMLGGGGAGLGPDLPAPGADFAAHYQAHWEAAYKARVAPLVQKLKKCRDPDRKNFAALERARRELAMREAASDDEEEEEEGGAAGDGGGVDQDAAVFGGPSTKRRKVAVEDPFGPAL